MNLILTMFPFTNARSSHKAGEWQHGFVAKNYKRVKKKDWCSAVGLGQNHVLQKCEWINRLTLLKLSKSTQEGKKTELQKGNDSACSLCVSVEAKKTSGKVCLFLVTASAQDSEPEGTPHSHHSVLDTLIDASSSLLFASSV